MKKKNTLHLKPLRRYNTPLYPSYLDKNPIEHPDTLPYPFTYKALQVLAGAGILVGTSCSSTGKASDSATVIQPEIAVQDSLVNPFTFEKLDVPFMPAMFGTGLPARLKAKEAREAISKIFQEEGIELDTNYHYKKDGINIKLDGYDVERKVGYVWINYENQGTGMIKDWRSYHYQEAKAKILDSSGYPYNRYDDLEYLKSYIARFMGNEMSWDVIDEYSDKFNKIDELTNEAEQLAAYKELYLDMLIHKAQNDEASAFAANKINKNTNYEQKKAIYINWLLKGEFDEMIQNIPHKTTLNKILDSILEIEDETLKEKQYEDLVNFIKPTGYLVNDPIPDNNRFTEDIEQMKKNIHDYANGLSDDRIALREAQKIDALPEINGDFIAPIGVRDRRFSYSHGIIEYDNGEVINPKDQALKTLETQVRQYIKWAKQQGGY